MASLFTYDSEFVDRAGCWLAPLDPELHDPMTKERSKADQEQARVLSRLGFIPLYDTARAKEMLRLGALQATTRVTGALWPYERAAWDDRRAHWGLKVDHDFYEELVRLVNSTGQHSGTGVQVLVDRLAQKMGGLSDEKRAALEAMMRLANTSRVLRFLEEL